MTNAIEQIIAAELAANPFATMEQIIETVETQTGIDIGDIAASSVNSELMDADDIVVFFAHEYATACLSEPTLNNREWFDLALMSTVDHAGYSAHVVTEILKCAMNAGESINVNVIVRGQWTQCRVYWSRNQFDSSIMPRVA